MTGMPPGVGFRLLELTHLIAAGLFVGEFVVKLLAGELGEGPNVLLGEVESGESKEGDKSFEEESGRQRSSALTVTGRGSPRC